MGRGRVKRKRNEQEQEREEGASSPFYSESGIPGCCQVTVMDRFIEHRFMKCQHSSILV